MLLSALPPPPLPPTRLLEDVLWVQLPLMLLLLNLLVMLLEPRWSWEVWGFLQKIRGLCRLGLPVSHRLRSHLNICGL